MLSGLEKAQLVVSLLGERSSKVLGHLSESSQKKLTSLLGENPDVDLHIRESIINELLNRIDREKSSGLKIRMATLPKTPSINMDDLTDPFHTPDSNSEDVSQDPFASSERSMKGDEKGQSSGAKPLPQMRFKATEAEWIATRLQAESAQITAFFLSQLTEQERNVVTDYLPPSVITAVGAKKIDQVPISEKIFLNLLEKLSLPLTPQDSLVVEDDFKL
jgi:flagellar motor switch protein FliG